LGFSPRSPILATRRPQPCLVLAPPTSISLIHCVCEVNLSPSHHDGANVEHPTSHCFCRHHIPQFAMVLFKAQQWSCITWSGSWVSGQSCACRPSCANVPSARPAGHHMGFATKWGKYQRYDRESSQREGSGDGKCAPASSTSPPHRSGKTIQLYVHSSDQPLATSFISTTDASNGAPGTRCNNCGEAVSS
jgi:hypothetical protein